MCGCFLKNAGEDTEYWNEGDSELDADFPSDDDSNEPTIPSTSDAARDLDQDQAADVEADVEAVVWWVVVFTCVFQTLHSLSSRALSWLLLFLYTLLNFLGRFSEKAASIARAFPSTMFLRAKYLTDKLSIPSVHHYVVCTTCLTLYDYCDCSEKRGSRSIILSCKECARSRKCVPLLKEVMTSGGKRKFYPCLVYPYASLHSSLQALLSRPGFYQLCEERRQANVEMLYDVSNGKIWHEFLQFDNEPFLSEKNNLAFMLNFDFFQPFKHRIYSVGVIYLAIMNLPREVRFKRENIIIVGIIPGPSEPSLTLNTYLSPLISDLLSLWHGVSFTTHDSGVQTVRCALLCVGCDVPAGRKTCGFLSHSANLGCTRCYCNFGTGQFGIQDYSGFNRAEWSLRSGQQHRDNVDKVLSCVTKTAREKKESELGCRYSCLLQLPYFDAVRMLIIDPMHNLYWGTAKYIFSKIWRKRVIITDTDVKTINNRISSLIIPSNVHFGRLPSCMDHSSSLTAEQWMLWVNYYSLFCLHGILPVEQLECWRHFVLASRLLCRRALSKDDIALADALLLQFCRRFELIYGPHAVTPNIHLHAHLVECVRDYGPMSSFWLFAFERFNGLLGDEPTNNRSIELQLMHRFLQDNANLSLLLSSPHVESEINRFFSGVVISHACSFSSIAHLDMHIGQSPHTSPDYSLSSTKYTISAFTQFEMDILSKVYQKVFPSLLNQSLAQSFRKMLTITIKSQKVKADQYVSAKSVFGFEVSHSSGCATRSVFSDPDFRPAKINYFVLHSMYVNETEIVTHAFANVSWPMHHPLQHSIGKPFQIWCATLYESTDNFIIALYPFHDETVLVTVPLVL